MNQTYLMFATPHGLVLYDHRNDSFIETINLQEIDCIYFDSMSIYTRAAISDDRIMVYNEKEGTLYEDYYIYHIPENAAEKNTSYEIGNDPKIFEKFSAEMISSKKAAVDTFEFFINTKKNPEVTSLLVDENGSDPSVPYLFSEYSYPLMEDTKVTSYHFLYQEGTDFYLCSVYNQTGTFDRKALKFSMEADSSVEPARNDIYPLPLFNCSLGDAALDAVCEYMNTNIWYKYQQPSDGIAIPAFIICKEKDVDDGKLFIGFFSSNTVVKNGDFLEVIGGNLIPAQIQVDKTNQGYTVTSAAFARDGAAYYEDLKAFADGDEALYQTMAKPNNIHERTRALFIDNLTPYLEENKIHVTYLLGFDNDPYKLSE